MILFAAHIGRLCSHPIEENQQERLEENQQMDQKQPT